MRSREYQKLFNDIKSVDACINMDMKNFKDPLFHPLAVQTVDFNLSLTLGQEADEGDKKHMQLPGQVKDEDDAESFTQMQAGTLGITGHQRMSGLV